MKSYLLVVLNSDPIEDNWWEQGLDIATTIVDLEGSVKVLLQGKMLDSIANMSAEQTVLKKLKQLSLFGIETYSLSPVDNLQVSVIIQPDLEEILANAKAVMEF